MTKKRIISILAVLAAACCMAVSCFAANDNEVVYTGDALACGASMTGFEDMLPGVPSSGTITLKNESGHRAVFYMDTEVVQTLQASDKTGAGYDVSLTCGDSVLFGSAGDTTAETAEGQLVGGDSTEELAQLNDRMPKGYQAVAVLDNGQSTNVTLTVTGEAESVHNNYEDALGNVEFRFQAENLDTPVNKHTNVVYETVKRPIQYLYTSVKTGDAANLILPGILMLLALAVMLAARKLKKSEEKK